MQNNESISSWQTLQWKTAPLEILLLVSHPDDDAIFAGELQRRLAHHRFLVVSVTYTPQSARAREMLAWQASLGTPAKDVAFLGQADDPEDRRQQRCSLDGHVIRRRLRALAPCPDLVVTHNEVGEYGHPHHRLTHRVASVLYPECPLLVFGFGMKATDIALPCAEKWGRVASCYVSQRQIITKLMSATETFSWIRPPLRHILTTY